MRETFIIKSAWESVFDDLSDKQAGVLIKAIFDYVATGEKPNLLNDGEIKMAFKFISVDLDVFEKRYQRKCEANRENGAKGGRPPKTQDNPNNPLGFSETQQNPNETETDNDNDNDFITTTIPDGIDGSVECSNSDINLTKNSSPAHATHTHELGMPAPEHTAPTHPARTTRPRKSADPITPVVVDPRTCIVSGNEWRTSFPVYQTALRQCYKILSKDEMWLAERKRLNSRVDVLLTLEKVCIEFWATEEGWRFKKKNKSNTINWKTTLAKSVGQRFNQVYENGTGSNQNNRGAVSDAYRERILRDIGAI